MEKSLDTTYNVIVVGAGPAGLMTALTIAQKAPHLKVALTDKRSPWNEPVACAEAVNRELFRHLFPAFDASWIRQDIDGVYLVSPNGTKVKYNDPKSGYIINRARFHKALAERCTEAGVHCNFKSKVTDISTFIDNARTVQYQTVPEKQTKTIKAPMVVDASGPGKKFCKNENIVDGNFDLEPARFSLVSGIDYDPNYIQMYFGHCFAPGGYAWLFPRSEGMANIGLVAGHPYASNISLKELLEQFIQRFFPGGKTEISKGGAIACGQPSAPLFRPGLLKVGDSASMVNPISRAGILESLYAGKLAANAIVEYFESSAKSRHSACFNTFEKKWHKKFGSNHKRIHRAKMAFSKLNDQLLDRAAEKIAKIPEDRVTLKKIFFITLLRNPNLLWQMRGMFLG